MLTILLNPIRIRVPIKDGVNDRFTPSFIYAKRKGLEELNATVRWTVAADGLMEANPYLFPLRADANESLPAQPKKGDPMGRLFAVIATLRYI